MPREISALAQALAERALETLEEVMDDPISENRDRLHAANSILDRGYGKPSQAIIQIPPNKKQAALLAAMSDEDLIAIIEQKQLPRLGLSQDMVTIEATASPLQKQKMSATVNQKSKNSIEHNPHGPASDCYDDETTQDSTFVDPLLE